MKEKVYQRELFIERLSWAEMPCYIGGGVAHATKHFLLCHLHMKQATFKRFQHFQDRVRASSAPHRPLLGSFSLPHLQRYSQLQSAQQPSS